MIRLFTLLLVLGLSHPLWSQTKSVQNIAIPAKTRLCPSRAGSGDREFSGHGPKVDALAAVSIIGNTRIRLTLTLHVIETRSDWTEAQGTWTYDVYTVPSGYKITRILSATISQTAYTDTNHNLDVPPVTNGNLVSRFEVMGDTGGDDVGNCTADDVYMNVFFHNMQVEIQKLETIITSLSGNADFPQHLVNKMSKGLNGLTHDNLYWYFTEDNALWKISRSKNLASIGELADDDMVQAEIPDYLQRNGYNQFGDLDYYQGYLWVSLQGKGRVANRPLIAVFKADNMELATTLSIKQWQNSIGCLAVNPATGLLFASTTGGINSLNRYPISINNDQITIGAPGNFTFQDRSGRKMALSDLQAAAFSADGRYLFLSQQGPAGGLLRSFNHRNGKEMYSLSLGNAATARGVTFWGTFSPGISGNLHLLMLHPDPVERDAYTFKHYTIQEALDWNG